MCIRSLASACHSAHRYSTVVTSPSWDLGKSPSKDGMEHYGVVNCNGHQKDLKIPACKRSSKSRAANLFISEALFENRRIIPRPKVGICRKLIDISFGRECGRNTHRPSNWATSRPEGSTAYKIRTRWVNTAFHVPSSNSCMTSTTSIEK